MSVHHDLARDRWVVRWREAGRQRARRFADEAAARTFESRSRRRPHAAAPARSAVTAASTPTKQPTARAGATSSDPRTVGSRRAAGFAARSEAVHARAIVVEQVRRGEARATSDTFAEFWLNVLEAKRPYVTAGTLQDYRVHGEKRLLPWFGELKLAAVDEDRVRDWLADMASASRTAN